MGCILVLPRRVSAKANASTRQLDRTQVSKAAGKILAASALAITHAKGFDLAVHLGRGHPFLFRLALGRLGGGTTATARGATFYIATAFAMATTLRSQGPHSKAFGARRPEPASKRAEASLRKRAS